MRKKRIRLAAIGLVLLAALGAGTWLAAGPASEAVPTAAWGLSFPEEGACPVGNATRQELARYDAAYVGGPEEPVIYLTFDAGYENGNTEKILDVLQARGVPAAFFVVGSFVESHPELVRRMAKEGHTVGNHTFHHWDMSKISDEAAFRKELTDLEDAYRAATGEELPKYYRPPQGIYSEENLTELEKAFAGVTSIEQIEDAVDSIIVSGLDAKIYGDQPVSEWYKYLLELAYNALPEQEREYLINV